MMAPMLAPLLAGGTAAAAGGAATAAVAGGTMANLALGAQALSGVASGMSAMSAGKAEAEQARVNSFIGRTRAIQTDTAAREGLNSELATMRAAFAASGQRPTSGTAEIMGELRRVRQRDRRIEFSNRMQEASAYKMQAQAATQTGQQGLIGGLLKAAPSVFEMYDRRRQRAGG